MAKIKEPFAMVPLWMLDHPAFTSMGFAARQLLVEFIGYYNGVNNGSIWIAPKVLEKKGFGLRTIIRATKELREHGFIYQTKRGGSIGKGCSFYALTWVRLNRVKGLFYDTFEAHAYEKFSPSVELLRSAILAPDKCHFGTSGRKVKKVSLPSNNQINDLHDSKNNSGSAILAPYKDMPSIGAKSHARKVKKHCPKRI